ncbi:hypothetical protein ACFW7J_00460 [Streptomyces sp. NPDC059525]|uniref:hypothetical protein n=1 Tax=Streptomyces sp. NPDC059525 TaxID=3346857 RepID=UPI0036799948
MTALTWLLSAVGLVAVAACGVQVDRVRGPSREVAIAPPVAAVLALPGPLADDAPPAAWGLRGATTIAAALTWAVAGSVRGAQAASNRPGGHCRRY